MPGDDALPPSFSHFAKQLEMPSEDYRTFLRDYFTGPDGIRQRREEDSSVWGRLSGGELESAKRMVLDNLGSDAAYLRALGIFRDPRAIPALEALAQTADDFELRLTAAKVLHDWAGYEAYPALLGELWPHLGEYARRDIAGWVEGLEREQALPALFVGLRDESQYVRFMAYLALMRFGNAPVDAEEARTFTAESAYADRARYEVQLRDLASSFHAEGI